MNLCKPCLIFLLLVWIQPGRAEGLSEDQVKSAYVLNITKFVEWPAEMLAVSDKINLCVVGNNVLGGALAALDGRKAGNRELHLMPRSYADDLAGCHVIFIGESEQRRAAAIIKAQGEASSLTISDMADFAEKGGCVGLLHRENKIVFEVNLASTRKAKIQLPSQVLNLAVNVFGR